VSAPSYRVRPALDIGIWTLASSCGKLDLFTCFSAKMVGAMSAKSVDYANIAFDLIDEFDRSFRPEQVVGCMSTALGRFGFSSFLVVDVPEITSNARPVFLLNGWPPAWAEHYQGHNYYKDDPVAARCRRSVDPFEWSEATYDAEKCPRAAEVMDAGRQFGLHDGFVVPIDRHTGTMSGVTMAGDRPDFEPRAKRAMHLIGLYAHAKAMSLIGREDISRPASDLTEGEREVLTWTAVGKSSWEISVILNMSEAGVVWRLKQAMSKLGANNKTQAVVNAIVAKQISV
jgi:LuxR family quorum sensing-dependent transcriptional regulator